MDSDQYITTTMPTGEVGFPVASEECTSAIPTCDQFTQWLIPHVEASNDMSTVDLIAAPCGIGKTRSITILVSMILQQCVWGAIIVTDALERMRNYVNGDSISTYDSYLSDYLERNRERILVYDSTNAKEAAHLLYKRQIVVMSTQRFFNLQREEVIALVNSYYPKRKIFFDERTPLSETLRIDIAALNNVDTALSSCLDDTVRQADKEWLLEQWRNLRGALDKDLREFERSHTDDTLYGAYAFATEKGTTDDARFLSLTTKTYADKLRKFRSHNDDPPILKQIRGVFEIVHHGAVIVSHRRGYSRGKGEYENCFLVNIDHDDLLLNIGSKVFILDGTGGIDPIYDKPYIHRIDCSMFQRDLSKLTINLVDVNTSKVLLTKPKPENNNQLQTIIRYIQRASLTKPQAIFTYKLIEDSFRPIAEHVAHFGSIKGRNDFRELTSFIQVGLNRERDEFYLSRALHNRALKYPGKRFISTFNKDTLARENMLRSLLSDVEQNLFRSALRNIDNDKEVTYTILFRCQEMLDKAGHNRNSLSELADMIRERYVPCGATVRVFDTPPEFKEAKTMERKSSDGKKTHAQIVVEWVRAQTYGDLVKRNKMLRECGLTANQFKAVLRNNPHIREMFEEMKTEKSGYYRIHTLTHEDLTA